jgi:hypothetical protein
VTIEELDIALEELELRVERLRALYEQYFLGFEKIEPSVARKDVDRRIYVLRREKIRNTGKRFKLQTIIQRYNTFQMYWQRICREIENGTYRRHLLRAERQLAPDAQLTIAARRRFGRRAAAGDDTTGRASSTPPAGGFAPNEAASAEMRRQDSDAPDSDDLATRRPPPPTPDLVEKRAPPPKPQRPRPASSRPPTPPDKYDSLELDMGFLGSWVPPARGGTAPEAKGAPQPKSSPRAAPSPRAKSSPKAAPPPKPKSSPRAAPPPKPPRAPDPATAGLSDDRVKDLHQKLSALKKENRETTQVSFESLAKTVREAEAKLRAQHKDRKIDFEVVVRDGKAIVKPTVR